MNRTGFTLLEILISIFIFGIIFTTVFMSYRTVFSNSDIVVTDVNAFETAKTCLNRMVEDLQSVYVVMPPVYSTPDFDDLPDPYRFVGNNTRIDIREFARLRFASLSHLAFDNDLRKGIAEIVYYVQDPGVGYFLLRRADHLYPYKPFQESKVDPILCERIKSLKFIYYDNENTPHPEWDSESEEFSHETPRAIGIEFELDGNQASPFRFTAMVNLPVYRAPLD